MAHTNLDHELSGRTHYDNQPAWYESLGIKIYILGGIITIIAIVDLFYDVEVTEVLSEVMMAVS